MDPALGTDLLIEHAHADREMEALDRAVRGIGRLSTAFKIFEIEILRHFDSEEREILIAFEREQPDEAVVILRQHDAFRALLREMSARISEGSFGAAELREIRIALSLHHAHEETVLYPWVRSKPSRWRSPRDAAH